MRGCGETRDAVASLYPTKLRCVQKANSYQ